MLFSEAETLKARDVRSQLLAQRVDERYISVIEYAARHGSVTNSDVQKILNTNRTTAYRILQQMGAWLEMHGVTGKNTYYTIKGLPNAPKCFKNKTFPYYTFHIQFIINYLTKHTNASQTLHKRFTILYILLRTKEAEKHYICSRFS